MDRRDFLTTSAAGAVAAAGLRVSGAIAQEAATADKPSAALNLGSQESKLPGKSLREKVENLQKFGGTGLEIGGNVAGRAQELKDAIAGTNVKISAVCAGYFALIDPDKAERQKGAERLKEVLSAAGEVGSTGVIMVPAFNKHPQLVGREAREALVELLPALGEHANKCGTRVLLEPLNRKEAYFLRQ